VAALGRVIGVKGSHHPGPDYQHVGVAHGFTFLSTFFVLMDDSATRAVVRLRDRGAGLQTRRRDQPPVTSVLPELRAAAIPSGSGNPCPQNRAGGPKREVPKTRCDAVRYAVSYRLVPPFAAQSHRP
ncbi:MAG: hypothetical protein ACRDGS_10545, partial [Chloroflexota bacterium]